MSLWLDFCGMARGVHWKVDLNLDHAQRHLRGDSYERLLGLPAKAWNMLRTVKLPADLDLLVQRIGLTLDIIQGVSWPQPPRTVCRWKLMRHLRLIGPSRAIHRWLAGHRVQLQQSCSPGRHSRLWRRPQ